MIILLNRESGRALRRKKVAENLEDIERNVILDWRKIMYRQNTETPTCNNIRNRESI